MKDALEAFVLWGALISASLLIAIMIPVIMFLVGVLLVSFVEDVQDWRRRRRRVATTDPAPGA